MIEVIFYKDKRGNEPVREWLMSLEKRCEAQGHTRITYLSMHGYQAKRPYAAKLRDGVYELRWRYNNVHHRILYSFIGKGVALLTVGCTKEDKVPDKEIELAIKRRDEM